MIYLKNQREEQKLMIPRNSQGGTGSMLFSLKNTIDLTEDLSVEVTDEASYSLYHLISLTLTDDLTEGEYEYSLTEDGKVLSSGLLIVTGESRTVDQYEKDITYEQYEAE